MSAKAVTPVLIALCAALAIVLFVQFYSSSDIEGNIDFDSAVNDIEKISKTADQYGPDKLNEYSVIAAKPLFTPSRQVKTIKKVITQQSEPSAVKTDMSIPDLIGVMRVDDVEIAFVVGKNESISIALQLGDEYKGWTLKAIESTKIVLSRGQHEETVSLQWVEKETLDWVRDKTKPSPNKLRQQLASQPSIEGREVTRLKDRLARQAGR